MDIIELDPCSDDARLWRRFNDAYALADSEPWFYVVRDAIIAKRNRCLNYMFKRITAGCQSDWQSPENKFRVETFLFIGLMTNNNEIVQIAYNAGLRVTNPRTYTALIGMMDFDTFKFVVKNSLVPIDMIIEALKTAIENEGFERDCSMYLRWLADKYRKMISVVMKSTKVTFTRKIWTAIWNHATGE